MIRTFSLSLAIVFLLNLPHLEGTEPVHKKFVDTKEAQPKTKTKLNPQDFTNPWQRASSVRDLAAFDISKLSSKTTGAWIVARIIPGGLSGTLSLPGYVIRVGGQWKLLDLLSGKAPPEGRYQWEYPYQNHDFDRSFSLLDAFSVFEGGSKNEGTVICQFFEKKTGAEQFSSVTLIPDGWKTFVKPAHEYYVKHTADFTGSDLNKLKKLAANDNPFIGLQAIRHILDRTTAKDMDMLVDLAHSLPKYRQAVLVFRLLKRDDEKSRPIVLKAISQAKNSGELTGIALGLYSWTVSQGRQFPALEPTRKLFDQLKERWQSFDSSTADDRFLSELLHPLGIQKGKSTPSKK